MFWLAPNTFFVFSVQCDYDHSTVCKGILKERFTR